ncbi:MAG: hypothetical protein HUK03_10460, partial [Bacteroidaceae bacterium]|nr:hypothetical protein [Bacteroidaceae bacterium]
DEAETALMPCYQEIYNNEAVGSGNYQSSDGASGGTFCGWLGGKAENNLQWRDVYVSEAGTYRLSFSCASSESRTLTVTVNGEEAGTLACQTDGWTTFHEFSLTCHLKAGSNHVTISNASAWMPNVDYLIVRPADSDPVKVRQLNAQLARLRALAAENPLPTKLQENIATLLQQAEEGSVTITTLLSRVRTMLTTVESILPILDTYREWKAAAESNIAVSQPSDALTTLTDKLLAAAGTLDGATTTTTATRALTTLQNALRAYFRSEEALPEQGQSFDMTVLIASHDMQATDGWSGTMPDLRSGCAQHYDKAFDMYQTLTILRPGIYTIQCHALFRIGDNNAGADYKKGTEVIPAVLYGAGEQTRLQSLYAYQWRDASRYGNVDNNNGYPHSMR